MSILYIDDDPEDLEMFHEAVRSVDPSIQYLSATSGEEAFEWLNTSGILPNHIILDINMPGMDGKVCLKEIRKDRKFDPINVVMYSTNSFPKDVEQIQSLGASFVRKANSFNDLCMLIQKLVNGNKV